MLDNATTMCHSPIVTDAVPPSRNRAQCGRNTTQSFVVRTAHNAERTAAIEIGLAGFDVFSPAIWLAATPARRYTNGSVRPALPDRIVPLFRRYVFVAFALNDPWRSILRLPGVETIISHNPESPSAVPQDAMDDLRGRCYADGVLKPPAGCTGAGKRYAVGSPVRVTAGPMEHFEGICDWSDGDRVRILLGLFGRQTRVTLPAAAVEAA